MRRKKITSVVIIDFDDGNPTSHGAICAEMIHRVSKPFDVDIRVRLHELRSAQRPSSLAATIRASQEGVILLPWTLRPYPVLENAIRYAATEAHGTGALVVAPMPISDKHDFPAKMSCVLGVGVARDGHGISRPREGLDLYASDRLSGQTCGSLEAAGASIASAYVAAGAALAFALCTGIGPKRVREMILESTIPDSARGDQTKRCNAIFNLERLRALLSVTDASFASNCHR